MRTKVSLDVQGIGIAGQNLALERQGSCDQAPGDTDAETPTRTASSPSLNKLPQEC